MTAYVLITVSVLIAGVWIGFTFADTIAALNQVIRDACFPPDTGRHISGAAPQEPGELEPEAAASVLLANRNAEALGFPFRLGLTPQEYAGAMHELSEPFLPPSPAGENPYPPYVPAWLPAVRKPTVDHPPWTGSQMALDDAAEAEWMRVQYVKAQLAECGDNATADDLRRVLAGLRTYGQVPQLEAAAGDRLADRVIA